MRLRGKIKAVQGPNGNLKGKVKATPTLNYSIANLKGKVKGKE